MNVSGLGRSTTSPGVASRVVDLLYRHTVSRAAWVFFQNDDDRRLFVDRGYVSVARSSRLPGSGVDLQAFTAAPLPSLQPGTCVFLMVARLLWDKGVREYVDAARMLRAVADTRGQALANVYACLDAGVRGREFVAVAHERDCIRVGARCG